ncbi:huntingtin-interacting protein 1-like isoform X2 [Acipenser oxyrinchus oxyrinchus]|uniref:Huntingtin-interacting protein 1-related protein n=1 Tax=Acipenser oxyrinchus oxyrinchus TaxID=40147 RepID=A0AAD8CXV0_ACIOX|nr:huntingtin-interacting protein 1-like isoform X2 [Acipenser oxyrinchus oxyrinchus]
MDLGKMAVSINKAINAQEVAVKEKHARTCILGTHHEKGALTFWTTVHRLPLSSNAVLCWKFCHVFHKLLRDGHHSVLKDSMRNKADLSDMSRMWGHLSEGYGKLCSIYLKLLITKMEFHSKNPRFPGNLMMTDKQLDEAGENDVNNFFQMTVEMFDYLECELNLFLAVFSSLDMSRSVSVTTAGQCRLAPLIQVILDCSHLYDYIVKLLFKLHSCLPADTLQGHRDRFQEQFRKYVERLECWGSAEESPALTAAPLCPFQNPPNFLRASALSEHISPVVVIPLESSSPDNEPSVETEELVDMDTALQPTHVESKFDDLFGTSSASDPFNFNSQNGVYKDDKDRLIEQLSRDIRALKEELETFKAESHRLCQALRGRISELEAELAEQTHLKQQALDEGEFLRAELEDLRRRREDTEKAQRSLTEVEKKAQANEQRYVKLKEKYTELVQSHAELLRKNAEVTRQVTVARAAQDEVESVRREMQEKLKEAQEASQHREKEQSEKLQVLQRELAGSREQLGTLRASITSSQQMSTDLSSKIEALEQDKGGLAEAVTQKEAELSVLGAELEQLQSTLSSERESAVKTAEALQNQLNEKESREQALERQLAAERLALLRSSVEEGERIIQDALARLEHPAHIGCTSSADYLVSRSQAALESLNRLQAGQQQYLTDPTDVSELLRAVAQLAHLVGDTIVQGSATSHMAPLEQADMLSEAVKSCGGDALAFLRLLKEEETLGSADSTVLREGLARITSIGEELRPKGLDINQGELGDLVEQELAATSAAVESAAARIEEMLSQARTADTGIKMEVNERILASCTDLMQAIKVLILSSKDLQRDIVESGRGAASTKEFYAKNSRWTEGLISASKAVGYGATVMVDAADLVVQGKGKFEELMVCSHEIAASTAQLVAASKVKADKGSANLGRLQQASRGVNQATASVVASTKNGKAQIEDTETMDFSSMTLTQIKRQEMDSQVRVLELENHLQKERQKLGELRKKHYELAGVAEGWEEEEGTGAGC